MVPWKNVLYVICVIFLLFFAIPIRVDPPETASNDTFVIFNRFVDKFNKTYKNNGLLLQKKYSDFQKNLKEIKSLNTFRISNQSANFGVTKFSDMSKDEFRKQYLRDGLYKLFITNKLQMKVNSASKISKNFVKKRSIEDFPMKVDWRDEGVVTSVNNQKYCGACWAFSTVQMIESMKAIKDKILRKLSVQQLIDCAGYNNAGCEGGDFCMLLYWLKEKNITIGLDKEYPLHWQTETCKKKTIGTGVQISDFDCYSLEDEEETILELLATHGPVVVAVNALMWQNYLGGVIHFHCDGSPMMLNHAVQIVGYDRAAAIPFYIVRNSWGADFGDKGYLYLGIGNNICGVANEVATVDVL